VGGNDSSDVQQTKVNDDDTDLFEIIIFNLSPVLGGRDQVLATPFYEVLKHLELHRKKKESDRWNGFLDNIYSDFSANIDKRKRELYIKTIEPEQPQKSVANNKTSIDQLMELKEKQEKRAKQSEQGG
jgi:hypothetical protein